MAQNPAKPPSISTTSPPALSSPRSRALTFGSTSDKATVSKTLPKFDSAGSNHATENAVLPGPPTTLENLAIYLDWRNAKFSQDDINPELWKIALAIWDFLPASDPVFYTINFAGGTKHTVAGNMKPPIRVTSTLSGDLLFCFYSKKQYIDYDDTSSMIVLMPYIDNIAMKGVSNWETTVQVLILSFFFLTILFCLCFVC